jgi:putative addiction module component (TIGR02574 family)
VGEKKIKKMLSNFTAKYKRISSGYMGQIVEWPEVVTEGRTIEECKEMLEDALKEMIAAYIELEKESCQKQELDKRLNSYYENPGTGTPWETVKERLLSNK